MNVWKTKIMLGLIWVGSVVMMGSSGDVGGKTWGEWLLWAIDAGLLAGLAVTLRHYYRQIRQNAVWEYRRNLMWDQFVKDHDLSNGRMEPEDE